MKVMLKAHTNVMATANANVIASNARAGANIAVTVNTNKIASNTKKCVPTYQQPHTPMYWPRRE